MVTCAAHKNKYLQACNPQTFNLFFQFTLSQCRNMITFPRKKIFQCNLRKSFITFEFIAEVIKFDILIYTDFFFTESDYPFLSYRLLCQALVNWFRAWTRMLQDIKSNIIIEHETHDPRSKTSLLQAVEMQLALQALVHLVGADSTSTQTYIHVFTC